VIKLPTAGRYLPQLDGIRAIAVGLVLLVHCVIVPEHGIVAWAFRHTLSNGWIGVDLFFALSGYLITSILLRSKSRPHYFRNFYARRFLRIFPLYYGLIAILAVAAPRLPFGTFSPSWPYLTYISNLWLVFKGWEWAPLGHAWSLAIEEQFYLLFPLVVLWLDKRRLRQLLWFLIAISPVIRVVTNSLTFPGASSFATFCRLDVLAMGALIAVAFDGRTEISEQAVRRIQVALACLTTATAVLWLTKQLDFKKVLFNAFGLTVVEATAALFVCFVLVCPGHLLGRVLQFPLAVRMGRISYGVYLIHYPVAQIIGAQVRAQIADNWLRTAVIAATSIFATLVLATLSWFAFERPILRLKRLFYEKGEEAVRVEAEMLDAPLSPDDPAIVLSRG
jgi:peptidoglycan/LPS O-acetylase OafA/YrhL